LYKSHYTIPFSSCNTQSSGGGSFLIHCICILLPCNFIIFYIVQKELTKLFKMWIFKFDSEKFLKLTLVWTILNL